MKQSRPKKPDHQTGRNIFKKKKKLTVKENNLKKKKANKSGEGVHAGEGEIFDKAKPISSEILEKLLEEEDVKDTEIKNFLANPWKNVSLEKINSSPTLSLEQNLPKVEKTSEVPKKKRIILIILCSKMLRMGNISPLQLVMNLKRKI